ncbi:MAG: DUF350 domain-containing protein [Spirochaetes bacterium]|nr:DUF350 domain-containing protein [Spirochaetota bacterium]
MNWNTVLSGIIDTAIFSFVGIVMMAIGFLLICLISPFSIKKEIEDDQNTALGIIIGSVILGISIIIASVIASPSTPAQEPPQAVQVEQQEAQPAPAQGKATQPVKMKAPQPVQTKTPAAPAQ